MKAIMIKDLKYGEYFTRTPIEYPKENQVYIKDFYDRSSKRYYAYKFSDICFFMSFKPDKIVYTDFTF